MKIILFMKRLINNLCWSCLTSFLERHGYGVHRLAPENTLGLKPAEQPYYERNEYGASNLATKQEIVKQGGPFEYPDIVNLNKAVALLIEGEMSIVEYGCGTGRFAVLASENPARRVTASEYDKLTYEWCLTHIKPRDNLRFINGPVDDTYGPFELVVAIELVEHLKDYPSFLESCAQIAPRALITTPNRRREAKHYTVGPPLYFKHVREWTAGEFYWILKCYWDDVKLYGLTSQTEPTYIPIDVNSSLSPLIADCRMPRK